MLFNRTHTNEEVITWVKCRREYGCKWWWFRANFNCQQSLLHV